MIHIGEARIIPAGTAGVSTILTCHFMILGTGPATDGISHGDSAPGVGTGDIIPAMGIAILGAMTIGGGAEATAMDIATDIGMDITMAIGMDVMTPMKDTIVSTITTMAAPVA